MRMGVYCESCSASGPASKPLHTRSSDTRRRENKSLYALGEVVDDGCRASARRAARPLSGEMDVKDGRGLHPELYHLNSVSRQVRHPMSYIPFGTSP